MSSLSSASTDAQVRASYDDNASYREDNSASKARAFITACRILLGRLPLNFQHGNRHMVGLDKQSLREQLAQAEQWLAISAAAVSGGGIKHVDFQGFRD